MPSDQSHPRTENLKLDLPGQSGNLPMSEESKTMQVIPQLPQGSQSIRQQWGPQPPSIHDVRWRGRLPAPGTCQISDIPDLPAAI